jgi:hypothetical protein
MSGLPRCSIVAKLFEPILLIAAMLPVRFGRWIMGAAATTEEVSNEI